MNHGCRRRTRTPRGIRGRRSDRNTCRANESACSSVIGATHPDGRQPPRHDVWDMRCLRQDDCERSGRKRREEMCGSGRHSGCDGVRHRKVCDMEDERIVGGTPLRLINAGARRRIQTVCTESVDRLRRKRNKRAAANEIRGTLKICGSSRAKNLRIHAFPPHSVYPITTRSIPPRSFSVSVRTMRGCASINAATSCASPIPTSTAIPPPAFKSAGASAVNRR